MPTLEEKEQNEKKAEDLELSDEDLDGVAGGAFIEPTIVRQPKPPMGFEDPLVANAPSSGFEVPLFRGK